MTTKTVALLLSVTPLVLGVISPNCCAQVVYDEAIDGDLNASVNLENIVSVNLSPGLNTILGSIPIESTGVPGDAIRDNDRIVLEVPPGMQITSLTLLATSIDFTGDLPTSEPVPPLVFVGGLQLGLSTFVLSPVVGGNPFDLPALGVGDPLPFALDSDSHLLILATHQLNPLVVLSGSFGYEWQVQVAVPEPSTVALIALAAFSSCGFRQRSR